MNHKKAVLLRPMRKLHSMLLLAGFILAFASCKSEFERVRVSGNPDLILQKAFDYYEKEQYQRAQTLFDLVLNNLRGRKEAERAYFLYAYTHYHLGQYVLAAYYFKNFSNTFTASSFREEAAFMVGISNYRQSPTFRLDQTSTRDAIEDFQVFSNLFPNSKRVEEANRLIDEMRRKLEKKAFAEGKLYFDLRQYQSAIISFDNLLRDYPESPEIQRVQYLLARSAFELAENSIVERKIERYQQAISRANDFQEKYPNGTYSDEVKGMIAKAEAAINQVKLKMKST